MFDERELAGAVAVVHAADLGHGGVRFVDDEQEVPGEEVDETLARGAGGASGEVAGVVFDALAIADFAYHLHVVERALLDALGFDEFAGGLEVADAAIHFGGDGVEGGEHFFARQHKMFGG